MGKTAYPTGTDLSDFLAAAGLAVGALDLATAAAAGCDEFERRAGRRMLAPGSDATRVYDPPSGAGRLDLGQDLAVLTSVVYQPEGAGAETLVQNSDFWLRPYNAAADPEPVGGPYLAIEFRRRWSAPLPAGLRRAIRVTGRWGYGIAIPEDAWLAMLARSAALLMPQKGAGLSGGLVRSADSGVERLYGEDPLSGARRAWSAQFEIAAGRYMRCGI